MPSGAIKVDRTTRWGNPWKVGVMGPQGHCPVSAAHSVELFAEMLGRQELRARVGYPHDLAPLRGHPLACWCAPGTPCHADILIREANN